MFWSYFPLSSFSHIFVTFLRMFCILSQKKEPTKIENQNYYPPSKSPDNIKWNKIQQKKLHVAGFVLTNYSYA